jgi:predicted secreted protein
MGGVSMVRGTECDLPSELRPLGNLGPRRGFAVLTASDGAVWLVIVAGEKPSSGYGISVKSVARHGATVTVTVTETAPGPDMMVLTVLTYPQVSVRLGPVSAGTRYRVVGGDGTVFARVR